MMPGLTGLWQVSGRSDIKDFDEVVKLDMQYIDNSSFLLDVKIILLTIGVVLFGKGAKQFCIACGFNWLVYFCNRLMKLDVFLNMYITKQV